MGYFEITVKRGEEFQAKQENIYDGKTFFHDAYRQAASCLVEILSSSEDYLNRMESRDREQDWWMSDNERANQRLLGYPNNVIAFCAERGHGKTSAMTSFSSALKEIKSTRNEGAAKFWEDVRHGKTNPQNYRYVVINRIDPTMMEQRDSIVKVILSRMFSRLQGYEKEREQQNPGREREKYRRLLERFRECFHNLMTLEQRAEPYDDEDELEQISELSDSTNMRGAICGLIQAFLEYVCPQEKACLVLQIDDADLNISQAYRIIDDIRRYLILPQTVVLLAANMHQLESVVEQDFISRYQVSIQHGGMVSVKKCHNIAARYVDKVIPGVRQIYLPDVDKEIEKGNNHIHLRYLQEQEGQRKELLEGPEDAPYQEQLLRFLYQRTGIILLHSDKFLHNLLPASMRELSHCLAYFIDMPKVPVSYWDLVDAYVGNPGPGAREGVEIWRKNLTRLEYYLTELWAPVNLRAEGHAFLRSLRQEPDSSKNRHILWFLPDYYSSERAGSGGGRGASAKELADYREEYIGACRKRGLEIYDESIAGTDGMNPAGCIHASYADVYEALSILTELQGGKEQYKFAYAVRLLYTIRLHQLLLDQTERYTEPGEENNRDGDFGPQPLTNLLGDVLFKRKNLNPYGWNYKILHQHYTFSMRRWGENYGGVFAKGKEDIQIPTEVGTFIRQFCRKEVPGKHAYVMRQLQWAEMNTIRPGKDIVVRYNVFYPCLANLNLLESGQKGERKVLAEHPQQQRAVVGSVALLLNWDVQYLFHTLYTRIALQEGYDPLDEIGGVYCGPAMTGVMQTIADITGDERYAGDKEEKIFAIYQIKKDAADEGTRVVPKNGLLMLYYTVPEFLEREIEKYMEVLMDLRETLRTHSNAKTIEQLLRDQEVDTLDKYIIHKALLGFFSQKERLDAYMEFRTKKAKKHESQKEILAMTNRRLKTTLDKYITELEKAAKELEEAKKPAPEPEEPQYSDEEFKMLLRLLKKLNPGAAANLFEIVDELPEDPPVGKIVAERIKEPVKLPEKVLELPEKLPKPPESTD